MVVGWGAGPALMRGFSSSSFQRVRSWGWFFSSLLRKVSVALAVRRFRNPRRERVACWSRSDNSSSSSDPSLMVMTEPSGDVAMSEFETVASSIGGGGWGLLPYERSCEAGMKLVLPPRRAGGSGAGCAARRERVRARLFCEPLAALGPGSAGVRGDARARLAGRPTSGDKSSSRPRRVDEPEDVDTGVRIEAELLDRRRDRPDALALSRFKSSREASAYSSSWRRFASMWSGE